GTGDGEPPGVQATLLPAMRDELLRRASGMVPVLKERAARTEQLRQIPPETVKDLIGSGLIRIGNPSRYGGLGVDLDTAQPAAWASIGTRPTLWPGSSAVDAGRPAGAIRSGPCTTGGSAISPSELRRNSSRPDRTRSSPRASTPRVGRASRWTAAFECRGGGV